MKKVKTGVDILFEDFRLCDEFKGKIGLLCHNASTTGDFEHTALKFKQKFGARFIKIFGPQHGFATDVQDNMVETNHFKHPYFKIPVYSLYSETRIPTDEMLEGIDHLFVDLQDIGCRMYTYIYTLTLLLEKCVNKDIQIVVLDRPNPINGVDIEGNILNSEFATFIGRHPLPARHGMTIGEVALMHQNFWAKEKIDLRIIKMHNWNRKMFFVDTGLSWTLPSPNLARAESALIFPGSVLFEGTQLSEGRGTSQPLEIIGHPKIEPFSFYTNQLKTNIKNSKLEGFALRPITFLPTFQKHVETICGGYQIHVTDRNVFRPWRVGQFLMRELYYHLGEEFKWKNPPYEYSYDHQPIDIINGSDKLRRWVGNNGSMEELDSFERLTDYRQMLNEIKLY